MNLKSSLLLFITLLLLSSCDKKRVFDQYKTVGSSWDKDSIVSFDLPIMDTIKEYNLFINIRDNSNYPFNNLFVIVSLEQANGQTKIDTLEYQMAEADGTLLGNGFTDIKENKLYYKERMKFKSGAYKVHIKQALRKTGDIGGLQKLEGITDVGFRIEKIE